MIARDYQIDIANRAAEIIRKHGLVYLAMQVRTGKTATALLTAENLQCNRVLFVTKKKVIDGILADHKALNLSFEIAVTNYEQLHNLQYLPDLIIVDEAHCLGQIPKPAKKVKILKDICKGKPIIYLSGTPTPENYSQLFHQLHISSFSPFRDYMNFYKWAADFVQIRQKYFKGLRVNDYTNANQQKIKSMSDHLFISFTQEQAGFKQSIDEIVVSVPMQASTYHLAEKLRKDKVYTGKDKNVILADTAAALLTKLHQIYTGSVIDESGEGIIFDRSKVYYIKEHFKGQKIAIFYKYKAEFTMLVLTFGYDRLTTDPAKFNESDNLIFVSQITSGREGINLSSADALVMLNIDFSAVSYWQARARLQSKDREDAAKVYWLFAQGGIEERIYNVVKGKKDYTLSYFKEDFQIQ